MIDENQVYKKARPENAFLHPNGYKQRSLCIIKRKDALETTLLVLYPLNDEKAAKQGTDGIKIIQTGFHLIYSIATPVSKKEINEQIHALTDKDLLYLASQLF